MYDKETPPSASTYTSGAALVLGIRVDNRIRPLSDIISSSASTDTLGVVLMLGLRVDNRIRPPSNIMLDPPGIANMIGLRAEYDEETSSSVLAENTTEIATHKNWFFPHSKDVAAHDTFMIALKIKPGQTDADVEEYLHDSGTQTTSIGAASIFGARVEYDTVDDHRLNHIIASDSAQDTETSTSPSATDATVVAR